MLLAQTTEELDRGRYLYHEHCIDCHGATGKGDGANLRFCRLDQAILFLPPRPPRQTKNCCELSPRASHAPRCRPGKTCCPLMTSRRYFNTSAR